MISHIFRKDLKLLWRMAVGVALINLLDRAIQSSAGIFRNATVSPAVMLSGLLGTVSLLATGVLIVIVVQEDPIPGLTQDWLVRPIRRRDLLLSKILFVALMVQGPILLIEVGQCLAAGFPIGPSLTAPLSRGLWMFLAMDLPVLAFATLTRSLAQAAGAGVAMVVGFALFTTATLFYMNALPNSIWVNDLAQVAWGLAGVAAVLTLQYYRRKTARARWLYGAAALVWLSAQFLPWQAAFAIEKRLSPESAAGGPVQIVFNPDLGKLQRHSPVGSRARGLLTADVHLFVPMRETGVAEGQILVVDRMSPRITMPGDAKTNLGDNLASPFIENLGYELVWAPKDIYDRLKDQPVTLEIDYSLTLLQAGRAQSIAAEGADRWIEGVGRCATRASAGGTEVELGCLAPGNMPCVTFSLEYHGTSGKPAQGPGCRSDYAPYVGHVNGDSISRLAREFASTGSRVKDEQVMITAYRPEAHFTRQVVIPNTRLSDWWVE